LAPGREGGTSAMAAMFLSNTGSREEGKKEEGEEA
jgi:hypothetical protein